MTGRDDWFVLPNRDPLTDVEWRWIEVLKSIVGGHLPPLTLQFTQDLQELFKIQKG
ncbi:hypothetical protein [Loktanella salsilacus]|uniref:hypothetical protein n=1 Tax=Loktanella salsilacus TaxID=195913 RepID=UPI00373514A2